jgi:dimethylaniline monooxygenase (N-oxide forming)
MSTLAKDFGGSPSLLELLREHGAFVTFVYWYVLTNLSYFCSSLTPLSRHSFSAAFTSHYRLLGPFRSPSAPEVVKTEIWETVKRRGWLGNLTMGVVPMLFYAWVSVRLSFFLPFLFFLLFPSERELI